MTASTSKNLIETIQNISSLVQASSKILFTTNKLEKWMKFVDDELLTDEAISSFEVLKSQILVVINVQDKEMKKREQMNKCELIMVAKEKERRLSLENECKKAKYK